jgi:hypothetical protein
VSFQHSCSLMVFFSNVWCYSLERRNWSSSHGLPSLDPTHRAILRTIFPHHAILYCAISSHPCRDQFLRNRVQKLIMPCRKEEIHNSLHFFARTKVQGCDRAWLLLFCFPPTWGPSNRITRHSILLRAWYWTSETTHRQIGERNNDLAPSEGPMPTWRNLAWRIHWLIDSTGRTVPLPQCFIPFSTIQNRSKKKLPMVNMRIIFILKNL